MFIRNKDRLFLFAYFLLIILAGSVLLVHPVSWNGTQRLRYIDALFTATSAVCVTGLITVDTAQYSTFGKVVILLLIQFGGLGIIAFTTIFIALPRKRISLVNRKLIGDYYLESLERNPRRIIGHIILFTALIELAGALTMYPVFRSTVGEGALFCAVFHSVSAFCNAGFSLFSDNLEGYVTNPVISFTIMALITSGGIGFLVLEDLTERLRGMRRRTTVHTRLVLGMSGLLIVLGAAAILLFDWNGCLADLSPAEKIQAALFASVTPRTAGYDTILPASFSTPSKLVTICLMFIGASPASTGGGIKTTTFFLIFVMILRGSEGQEDIRAFGKKIGSGSINRAMMLSLRAVSLLALAVFLLCVTELFAAPGPGKDFLAVVYETFSAFGTVGLSLGLTPLLTDAGKVVIILSMFAGRVGMSALAIPLSRSSHRNAVDYPTEEVLIG